VEKVRAEEEEKQARIVRDCVLYIHHRGTAFRCTNFVDGLEFSVYSGTAS
jgi:hypothetical protein